MKCWPARRPAEPGRRSCSGPGQPAECQPHGPRASDVAFRLVYSIGMGHKQPLPQAVFLDRDGTLIENRHYLGSPEGVVLLPGVQEALRLARARRMKLFLFTNQSGVGRGYFTLADVEAVNRRLIDMLGLGADLFTSVCVATERPDEPPMYRKPSPRFIEEMLRAHGISHTTAWMVGDAPSDWLAGLNAGVHVAAIVGKAARDRETDELLRNPSVSSFPSVLAWMRSLEEMFAASQTPTGGTSTD